MLLPEVTIEKEPEGGVTMQVKAISRAVVLSRDVPLDEWYSILDKLYGELLLHEWKKRFKNPENPQCIDEDNWRLKVR